MGVVVSGIALILAGLFAVSGAGKMGHPREFSAALARYRLVPHRLLPLTSRVVAVSELFVAGWLLLDRGPGPLIAALLLLGAFTAALVSSLSRGLNHACGCFGAKSSPVSWWLVARNSLLIVVTISAASMHSVSPSRVDQLGPAALLAGVLVAEFVLVVQLAKFVVATRHQASSSSVRRV